MNEFIEYIVKSFGHLINRNETLTSLEFCNRIKNYYSIDNEKTSKIKDFLTLNDNITFMRENDNEHIKVLGKIEVKPQLK